MFVHNIARSTQTSVPVPALAAKYRINPSNTQLSALQTTLDMKHKETVIKSTSKTYFQSVVHGTPVVLLRFSLTQQNRDISFCQDSWNEGDVLLNTGRIINKTFHNRGTFFGESFT